MCPQILVHECDLDGLVVLVAVKVGALLEVVALAVLELPRVLGDVEHPEGALVLEQLLGEHHLQV